jgi:uncharacterized membrane protein
MVAITLVPLLFVLFYTGIVIWSAVSLTRKDPPLSATRRKYFLNILKSIRVPLWITIILVIAAALYSWFLGGKTLSVVAVRVGVDLFCAAALYGAQQWTSRLISHFKNSQFTGE